LHNLKLAQIRMMQHYINANMRYTRNSNELESISSNLSRILNIVPIAVSMLLSIQSDTEQTKLILQTETQKQDSQLNKDYWELFQH